MTRDAAPPRLTVVIPTLNEADTLAAAVASVAGGAEGGPAGWPPAVEVVVSDSGSSDGTAEVALGLAEGVPPAALSFLAAPTGGLPHRAAACNRGAAAARGGVLLFLDADARLPAGWLSAVGKALAAPTVVGGGFHLRLDGPQPGLRFVERVNRWRYHRSRLFYGDQGLFCRAADFQAVGGFPDVPVLESARLCRRLKRRGRLALLDGAVTASARRFQEGGVGRVFATDVLLWARGLLRLGPGTAGRRYWHWNRRRNRRPGSG